MARLLWAVWRVSATVLLPGATTQIKAVTTYLPIFKVFFPQLEYLRNLGGFLNTFVTALGVYNIVAFSNSLC